MYQKNNKLLIFIAFFVTIIVPIVILFYINYNDTHFRCDAEYSAVSDDYLLVSKSSLIVNGGRGTLMIDGRITNGREEVYFFKVRNYFKIEKNRFSYNFNSLNVSTSPEALNSAGILSEFFADVFIKEGVSSFFYIYSLNKNYVIASGNMPLIFCMKHAYKNG